MMRMKIIGEGGMFFGQLGLLGYTLSFTLAYLHLALAAWSLLLISGMDKFCGSDCLTFAVDKL